MLRATLPQHAMAGVDGYEKMFVFPVCVPRDPSLQISTVDGFQGREVDVVIFSCVRAPLSPSGGGGGGNESFGGGLGFLTDRRRMNVAITRARRSLIVLGNRRWLSSDSAWRALFHHAEVNERLVPEYTGRSRERERERGASSSRGGVGGGICDRVEAMAVAVAGLDTSTDCREITTRGAASAKGKGSRKISTRDADSTKGNAVKDSSRGIDGSRGTDRRDRVSGDRASDGRASDGSRGNAPSRSRDTMEETGSESRAGVAPSRRQDASSRGESAVSRDTTREARKSRDTAREDRKSRADTDANRASLEETPCGSSTAIFTQGKGEANRTAKRPAPPVRGPISRTTSVVAGEAASVQDSVVPRHEGRSGTDTRPVKRARVAASQSESGAVNQRANAKAGNRPVDSVRKHPSPESGGGGFLGGLLGSLNSNAGNIASGKDYDFQQGLRGGEVWVMSRTVQRKQS